ncbi:MAG: pantoate--beta-alanine ligase [Mesoaciditoga sp.]|uniref:pantoate--beta-alanine ligase n=3 Tax=Athalassotoga sp. TaxID=2022597 RepID=UPI000CC453EC|nr:MAG: pantoate--beta-alanine ligase [Mesoaciditoga sp.]PMP78812.1 MAG: pantoate--beta-alanine ligase [Mesoaciditoga sp.]HEU24056.1 pantoate--beta-alanine ligase [Mesoaciditoga lauensis]
MKLIRSVNEMISIAGGYKDKTVGFVPTMGALHAGHLSLVRKAKEENEIVVVSIFVNPKQFGPNEDFNAYPRVLEKDQNLLEKENVDYLFTPSVEEMYPEGFSTSIHVANLTDYLCGYYRPGHFDGVVLVVNKLFNIVRPKKAYFGQKDAQQFRVLRRMVEDLNMGIEMIEMPIVRESDGLAMSSRNAYLSVEERKKAPILHEAIKYAADQVRNGRRDAFKIKREAIQIIRKYPEIKIQYFEIVDEKSLVPVSKISSKVIVAAAIFIGKTRLIDNEIVNIGDKI